MKKNILFLLIFIFFAFKQDVFAQSQCDLDMSYTNTGSNMTVFFTPPVASSIYTELGDGVLGAFFIDSEGANVCAASVAFTGAPILLAVMADDATTTDKDGFASGESINWFYESTDGLVSSLSLSPNDTYSINGLSNILSASASTIDCGGNDVEGCTDPDYVEYVNNATIDNGSCQTLAVVGCTDVNACNYDSTANLDNGTCYNNDLGCGCDQPAAATGYDCSGVCLLDSDGDGVCDTDEIGGCYDSTACNYNIYATESTGCIYSIDHDYCATCSGGNDGTGTIVDNDADNDGICDADEIVGCQDETACNYNVSATNSAQCLFVDGICEICSGEQDGTGTIVDNDADNDGVCDADEIVGCQDATAVNYDPVASDEGSCVYSVFGCQDPTACNFDILAGIDDGTCYNNDLGCGCDQPAAATGYDCSGVCLLDSDGDDICDAFEVSGCQNPNADNFDSLATDDDGSCIYYTIHNVNAGSYYFTDITETVYVGDQVCWFNDGGYHDVNFAASYGNPQELVDQRLGPNTGGDLGCITFNTAGSFTYDCSIGNHAAQGMVATINVIEVIEVIEVLGPALSIQGVMDLNAPSFSNDGKAIHLVANADIPDLSLYGFNNSNNGGGSDGVEWAFPAGYSASDGDDILIYRVGTDPNFFSSYFGDCFSEFELIITNSNANEVLTINGDDPMELFEGTDVIDNYGDVNASSIPGDPYEDSWVYRADDGTWIGPGEDGDVESNDAHSVYTSINPYPLCPIVYGCIDSTALNFDSSAYVDTGVCNYPVDILLGCTDSSAFNFNPDATQDDESCIAVVEGCTDTTAFNHVYNANTDDGSCIAVEFGCLDENALNTDSLANTEDGSCQYQPLTNAVSLQGVLDLYGGGGTNVVGLNGSNGNDGKAFHLKVHQDVPDLSVFSLDVVSNGTGTLNPDEFRLSGSAIAGDDILVFRTDGSETFMADYFGACYSEFEIKINTGMSWPTHNGDDGTALFENYTLIDSLTLNNSVLLSGAMSGDPYEDSWAYRNEDGSWNFAGEDLDQNDNSYSVYTSGAPYPLCSVIGCTDNLALNYNPAATNNDGSCEYAQFGCTDTLALNYNPAATNNDGSCDYSHHICTIPQEFNVNTGSNMTVFFTSNVVSSLPINSPSPYVVAIASSGLVVGSVSLAQDDLSNGQQAMAVWGDDTSTPETDGAISGEAIDFQLVDGNSLFDLDVSFAGSNLFQINATPAAIAVSHSLICSQDNIDVIFGCTDTIALNYNPAATSDDGSCVFLVYGCQDSTAYNYNLDATVDDGSCIYFGCIYEVYPNYDPVATYDDGSCTFDIEGCTDSSFVEYYSEANINDGSCATLIVYGCQDSTACNYNSNANMNDNSCIYAEFGYNCEGDIIAEIGDIIDGGYLFYIDETGKSGLVAAPQDLAGTYEWGCWAINVDGADNTHIGSGYQNTLDIVNNCVTQNGGLTAAEAALNAEINQYDDWYLPSKDELSEMYTIIGNIGFSFNGDLGGFGDHFYWSSSEFRNTVAWSVIFSEGEIVIVGDNYGNYKLYAASVRPIRSIGYSYGCMDTLACNFNSEATVDDGSCYNNDLGCGCDQPAAETGYDCSGVCLLDSDGDGICDADEIVGCYDSTACNYNIYATESAECLYSVLHDYCATCSGETDGTGTIVDNDADNDGICDNDEIVGCQDETACNYNVSATNSAQCLFVDGICEICSGEQDGTGTIVDNDYDNDGICDTDEILGCQDPLACNFDIFVTTEDGSCIYDCEVEGCTDPSALNYESNANISIPNCSYGYINDSQECNIPDEYYMGNTGSNYTILLLPSFIQSLNILSNTDAYIVAKSSDGSVVGSTCVSGLCLFYGETALTIWGDDTFTSHIDGAINNDTLTFQLVEHSGFYGGWILQDLSITSLNESSDIIFSVNGFAVATSATLSPVCSIDVLAVEGCTNIDSENYNEYANSDDGSCIIYGCTSIWADNYQQNATSNDGSCYKYGCSDSTACNFDPNVTIDNASCYNNDLGCGCDQPAAETGYDCAGICLADSDGDGVCDAFEISGCQDPLADNFDFNATDDDGSCQIEGCTDPSALNYEPNANISIPNCGYGYISEFQECNIPEVYSGNTGSNMTVFFIPDVVESFPANLVEDAYVVAVADNSGLVVGSQPVFGVTQTSLAVWGDDSSTPENDGAAANESITYYLVNGDELYDVSFQYWISGNGSSYITSAINAATSANITFNCSHTFDVIAVEGCTNIDSENYNEYANSDDGSCIIYGCTSIWADNYQQNATSNDGSCYKYGCSDSTACNFDPNVTIDNASCYNNDLGCGCDQPAAETGYDCSGVCLLDSDGDGICDAFEIAGCQNPNADNFNSLATDDDGSCVIYGCIFEWGNNFNMEATHDDSSCTIILSQEEYFNMENLMNNDFYSSHQMDSILDINTQMTNNIILLDSIINVQQENITTNNFQYGIIVEAFGILEDAYTQADPDAYGKITLELKEGWNMIGYNLISPSNVIQKLSDISSDIELVKDNDGKFYWPGFGYNSIGDFIPGHGYFIKMHNNKIFSFEP